MWMRHELDPFSLPVNYLNIYAEISFLNITFIWGVQLNIYGIYTSKTESETDMYIKLNLIFNFHLFKFFVAVVST